jgi:collagenase-like PrtC family protease
MPIQEDEHGTYIMNSKDLRAVEHVQRLVEIGVDSLKIEGRTKSRYYVSRAAQVYRRAIDDAVAGRSFDPNLLAELEGLSNRGYTSGFYQRHRSELLGITNELHGAVIHEHVFERNIPIAILFMEPGHNLAPKLGGLKNVGLIH